MVVDNTYFPTLYISNRHLKKGHSFRTGSPKKGARRRGIAPSFCIFIGSYSLGTQFRKGSNIIEDFPKIKPKNAKIFSEKIDQEIDRFRSYYEQGVISAEKFVKIVDAIKKGK
ncbi:MAG: hypothetical protein HFG70_07805 [Hungatella sp.]|nr:hypothetical protein [Hungatella sp.]MCI9531080.1 hypothetical protein [Lachnospiraceae bacterium]